MGTKKSRLTTISLPLTLGLILTGCSTGPTQGDTYACQDWGAGYDLIGKFDLLANDDEFAAMGDVMSDAIGSAASEANDSELQATLEESSTYWAAWASAVRDIGDFPDGGDDLDKKAYRICRELGIEVTLKQKDAPSWYEGK